jgi:hypothetical protein
VLDTTHYDGPSTAAVQAPTPLGRRARLQVAGLGPEGSPALPDVHPVLLPSPAAVVRPLDEYVAYLALLDPAVSRARPWREPGQEEVCA